MTDTINDDVNWKSLFYRVGRQLYILYVTEKLEYEKEAGKPEDFSSEHEYVTHKHYDPLIRELNGRHCMARAAWMHWLSQNQDIEFVKDLDKEFGFYGLPE